jgi:hypothetical protein
MTFLVGQLGETIFIALIHITDQTDEPSSFYYTSYRIIGVNLLLSEVYDDSDSRTPWTNKRVDRWFDYKKKLGLETLSKVMSLEEILNLVPDKKLKEKVKRKLQSLVDEYTLEVI